MKCQFCKKKNVGEPHSMAILAGGALEKVGKDSAQMLENAIGFIELIWHGAHNGGKGEFSEIGASHTIADNCDNGQFELYFCSTDCLRKFLNKAVDSLEKKMKKGI